MRCSDCGFANPSTAKFCQECGGRLSHVCAGCATELPPSAKFCHECGRRTAETSAPRVAPPKPADPVRELAGGRYELRDFLGEGGKKRVHLAWDRRLEREVALALIKSEGLDASSRTRVQREAQAMAQLGDHPNIVTVYDIGEEGEQLYIVSQYMRGGDLDQRLQETGGSRRLPLEETVRIGSELCKALAHAHERGVVHRDVKPGNVWLAEDGTVKLGDFGLAISGERSRLTQEGMMIGTVAYMAPEQALGRSPDARADLYALGATLYEMLTGRPPFLGDDAVAIISQHLNTQPVAPSWHNGEVPEPLERLVLRLLEKDPHKRPETARSVGESLAAVLRVSQDGERPEAGDTNPLDRLASGVFVGREGELEELRHGVDEALSARGRVLLLVGEPGIGKTRTSEELATYARLRGAQVLWGRCYEGDGAPAYWPWMQIVRAYVHEQEPHVLMSQMGPGAADIAEVVSEVRERLPGLPAPPKLDPEQARFRLFDSVTGFLRNASQKTPLMLVLDDLHWADRPSLLLLEFLARELESRRILVLATYRDVEVGRQHPLEQTLGELARGGRAERVLLRGLSEDDVARFLSLSSAHTPPPSLVTAVFRETEGNPFFVHEVVRLLQADGRLDHPEAVESWSVEIPQGVRQVVGRRLDSLSSGCNELLTIASIIGREFDARLLADVAEKSELETIELMEEAEDARILLPMDGTPGSYRFSHALVRETLYGEVRTTRRLLLHRRIGDVIERRHADRIDKQLAALAYHYCEAASGGDVAKAVGYAQRAAWKAQEALAWEDAANHFERALVAMEAAEQADDRLRCELMLSRAGALHRGGSGVESSRIYGEAYELARRIGSPLHVAVAVIGGIPNLLPASELETANFAKIEKALELLGDDRPVLRARLLCRKAGQLAFSHAGGQLEALGAEIRELIEGTDDLAAVRDAHFLETVVLVRNQPHQQLEANERLLERALHAGNRTTELEALAGITLWTSVLGDVEASNRSQRRVRELAEELRQASFNATAYRLEAFRAMREGDLNAARDLAWRSRSATGRLAPTLIDQFFNAQLFHMRRLQGRMAETLDTLRAGVKAFPTAVIWPGLLVTAYAESREREPCRKLIDGWVAENFATFRTYLSTADMLALVAEGAIFLESAEAARFLYDGILPVKDWHLQANPMFPMGPAGRVLGNLAVVLGDFDAAEQHFETAVALDRRMGARGWAPRTQCDYANMLLRRGMPGDRAKALSLLEQATATAQELGLKGWLDRCIETRLRAQGLDSGTVSARSSIDIMAASVSARQPDFSRQAAPDGTITLMFSDMVEFTSMTERLGDVRAREVIREHHRIVRQAVQGHGGHEVELRGDGFLMAFRSARNGVHCAVAIQRAFAEYNAGAEEPIHVRIGLHTGEALRERDKFFGKTVILASRIADVSSPDEILVSDLLRQVTDSLGDLRFGASRTVKLKGISAEQTVHPVAW